MKRVIFSLVISLALLTMVMPVYADSTYVVKAGDSLTKIAAQFGVSAQAIAAANNLADPNLIRVGQRLIIPAPGTVPAAPAAASAPAGQTTYRVQAGDSLYKISRQHGVSLTALMTANGLTSHVIYVGQVLKIPSAGPAAVAPAAPAAPASGPVNNVSRGLHGLNFYIENRSVHAGDEIWFGFTVANTGPYDENYGVLSIHSDYGISGQSWTNQTFKGWAILQWRDHIEIDTPGLYPLYLAICYAGRDACLSNQAPWERLSPTIIVAVDTPLPPTGYSSRGVRADYFYVENLFPSPQDRIWFDFGVTNTNPWDVPYGALSAVVVQTATGSSWTNSTLKPGQALTWRDYIPNLYPGLYAFYLGICYAEKNECAQNPALWERLSDNVYVTVE